MYLFISLSINLYDWCFTQYARISHLYNAWQPIIMAGGNFMESSTKQREHAFNFYSVQNEFVDLLTNG